MEKVHKRRAEHASLVDVWHVWCHMSPLVKESFKTDQKWLNESPYHVMNRWYMCLLQNLFETVIIGLAWNLLDIGGTSLCALCSPALHLSHIYIFQISVLIFQLIVEIFLGSRERWSRDSLVLSFSRNVSRGRRIYLHMYLLNRYDSTG